jgi:hypothetical protein
MVAYTRPAIRARPKHDAARLTPLRAHHTGRAAEVWQAGLTLQRLVLPEWAPPADVEGYQWLLEMHDMPTADFLARTAAYYERHPKPAVVKAPAPEPPVIDANIVAEAILKRSKNMTRYFRACKKAGYSDESLALAIASAQAWKDNEEELQAEIVRRWGSAPTKSVKKAIKAVKKKL